MTRREEIQNELVALIESLPYNAPYGVLTSLKTTSRGSKAREITFGRAATLDATLTIWSPTMYTMRTQGPLSYKFGRLYSSLNEVKQALTNAVKGY